MPLKVSIRTIIVYFIENEYKIDIVCVLKIRIIKKKLFDLYKYCKLLCFKRILVFVIRLTVESLTAGLLTHTYINIYKYFNGI